MKRGPIALTVLLVVAAGSAAAPTAALAGRAHGRPGGHQAVAAKRPFGHHHSGHHRQAGHHHHQHFGSRHFGSQHFVQPFLPLAVFAPSVVYVPSPLYEPPPSYAPPVYYRPPVGYSLPAGYGPPAGNAIPAAPHPPVMSVVGYPTGQYELRGDGATTPYTWVWIPNPPPPPPAAPPANGSLSLDPSRPRISRLYRWTDGDGVAHWTDRWEAVPEQHRASATPPSP